MKTKRKPHSFIGYRPKSLAPLISVWMDQNPGAPLAYLFDTALRRELRPLAGKRYAHLVEEP